MYVININTHDLSYFYTICISEQYRSIVGFSPTPGQQLVTILCYFTITVGFQSHIYHVTYYFVFMLEKFTSQNTETHYLVIISSYREQYYEQ